MVDQAYPRILDKRNTIDMANSRSKLSQFQAQKASVDQARPPHFPGSVGDKSINMQTRSSQVTALPNSSTMREGFKLKSSTCSSRHDGAPTQHRNAAAKGLTKSKTQNIAVEKTTSLHSDLQKNQQAHGRDHLLIVQEPSDEERRRTNGAGGAGDAERQALKQQQERARAYH